MKSRTLTFIAAMTLFAALAIPVRPAAQDVTGSGTPKFVPQWTGSISPSTSLGNSSIFQTGANVGIGTTTNGATLAVTGPSGSIYSGAAPTVITVTGGTGGLARFLSPTPGGAGGGMQLTSGNGGAYSSLAITAEGGRGAAVVITGGSGATCLRANTGLCSDDSGIGGNGGSIILKPGAGGSGTGAGSAGNVHVIGNFLVTGTKNALVETASYGKRQLYAVESPENWFEDFGGAQLVHGRATVKLDPIFAETVSTDEGYYVFFTPKGDCNGLYVAIQSANSFEVRELRHGKGTIPFDYRVVAKRKGYERARLAELKDGEALTAGR